MTITKILTIGAAILLTTSCASVSNTTTKDRVADDEDRKTEKFARAYYDRF